MKLIINIIKSVTVLVSVLISTPLVGDFVHPGIPWTINDLDQMKANRTVEPWSDGWDLIANSSQASLSYTMQGPAVNVDRVDTNITSDGDSALYHAIQWYFTEEEAHATKAIGILEEWAAVHKTFSGNAVHLHAAWRGGTMVKAAEILRYTHPGWTEQNTVNMEAYFLEVLWPQFRLPNPLRAANQGANNLWGAIQVAVFCDDEEKFNQCIDAYLNDHCAGISNTLPNGQNGDSGRDQGHAGSMIGNLADVAEIAWAQGVDLYGVLDNRLLAVTEYWAKYNLGEEVEWVNHGTCYDYFVSIGEDNRDTNSVHVVGLMEKIYGAYVIRKGLDAPYTTAYREVHTDEDTFFFRKDAAYDSDAEIVAEPVVSAETTPVTELLNADIGDVGVSGSTSFSDGVWTIQGAGADLNGGATEDAFQFAYHELAGDGAIIAQVLSVENTDPEAKAGVVIRESLAPDAKMLSMTVEPTGGGASLTSRGFIVADGSGFHSPVAPESPIWVKIERRGKRVVGYLGPDGVNWAAMQTVDFDMSEHTYVGLGASSKDVAVLNTSTFSDVQITGAGSQSIGVIQAEDFSDMSGVETEATSDVDGGLNATSIDDGDWIEYFLNIPLTGDYTLNYRVASNDGGGSIRFEVEGEAKITTAIDATGGAQNWTTLSTTISLSAGAQTIRLHAEAGGWNLNWFELEAQEEKQISAASVFLSPTAVSMTVGATEQMIAQVKPEDATDAGVVYSSSDTSIVTVDQNGLITAVAEGEAMIIATSNDGGHTDESNIFVSASGSLNLALGKTVTQSSTGFEGVPERAVDGDTNGLWNGGSVTHTVPGIGGWWQVDLGSTVNIGEVEVFGRTDTCCIARLSFYTVSILDSNEAVVYEEDFTSFPNPSVTLAAGGVEGQFVRIELDEAAGEVALSLAEVEVYEFVELDTDGDGIPDHEDADDDNDGVDDVDDAFPLDPSESVDTDEDGIGDNSEIAPSPINVSTRGYVLDGDKVMIAGFVIDGTDPATILIQGVGPELGDSTFTDYPTIADPTIEVYDADGNTVGGNDDWESDDAAAVSDASIIAGSYTLEAGSKSAALVTTLEPGAYTVILSSAEGQSGIALIEAYNVSANISE
ncbi:carbohydrate-binding protein [Puniceicoccaceae bacterium K14]|nr:carbohydrate-binding protein [Puniceicoccaceae bacterium K14]